MFFKARAGSAGTTGTSRLAACKPARDSHTLSVVIAVFNEQDNIRPLLERSCTALSMLDMRWQIIVVDDGSTDGTVNLLREAVARYPGRVSALVLGRNLGQTAAMQAGIDAAHGSLIATLDGDLQNDPFDIPRMVRRLLEEDLDLLAGWRRERKDNFWLRTLPSRIANRLIGALTGVRLHDYGCTLKVFRAAVIRPVRLYGEMHRFIPSWIAMVTARERIAEQPVAHAARLHGVSKYGLSRSFKVMLDLLTMIFFMRFRAQPGHFFGRIGMACGAAGFVPLAWLTIEKLAFDASISDRPLLLLGILLTVVGVQFICTGILMEMLARTYFEATGAKTYAIREVLGKRKGARVVALRESELRGFRQRKRMSF